MTALMSDTSVLAEAEQEHRYAGGWKGADGEGDCGAYCACGETYAGFDTLGEASELVEAHVRKMNGDNGCDATATASPDGSSDGSPEEVSSTGGSPSATSCSPPSGDATATGEALLAEAVRRAAVLGWRTVSLTRLARLAAGDVDALPPLGGGRRG